jgi:hypothetical protein
MEKHNNFNIASLQEKRNEGKVLECSIDERCIIDFLESTIREKWGDMGWEKNSQE